MRTSVLRNERPARAADRNVGSLTLASWPLPGSGAARQARLPGWHCPAPALHAPRCPPAAPPRLRGRTRRLCQRHRHRQKEAPYHAACLPPAWPPGRALVTAAAVARWVRCPLAPLQASTWTACTPFQARHEIVPQQLRCALTGIVCTCAASTTLHTGKSLPACESASVRKSIGFAGDGAHHGVLPYAGSACLAFLTPPSPQGRMGTAGCVRYRVHTRKRVIARQDQSLAGPIAHFVMALPPPPAGMLQRQLTGTADAGSQDGMARGGAKQLTRSSAPSRDPPSPPMCPALTAAH
jgi:hypothetical protein